jgi:hypothetical protein
MATDVQTASAPASELSAGAAEARERKRAERRSRWRWRIAGYVFFLAIWQFTSMFLVQDFILPPPATIAEAMWDIIASDQLVTNFAATLKNIAIGSPSASSSARSWVSRWGAAAGGRRSWATG